MAKTTIHTLFTINHEAGTTAAGNPYVEVVFQAKRGVYKHRVWSQQEADAFPPNSRIRALVSPNPEYKGQWIIQPIAPEVDADALLEFING